MSKIGCDASTTMIPEAERLGRFRYHCKSGYIYAKTDSSVSTEGEDDLVPLAYMTPLRSKSFPRLCAK